MIEKKDTMIKQFFLFHLINYLMYYLLLLTQALLEIFEAYFGV